jgi:hypothetical protein
VMGVPKSERHLPSETASACLHPEGGACKVQIRAKAGFMFRKRKKTKTRPKTFEKDWAENLNFDQTNFANLPTDFTENVNAPLQELVSKLAPKWALRNIERI